MIWGDADSLATCRLTYVEARAALAAASRSGRLPLRLLDRAKSELAERWDVLEVVELDEQLAVDAGDVAETYRLHAGDAAQLAAALALDDELLVFVSWDEELRRAAAEAGLAVAPAG